ncbi:MAG TPA: hypothetical protein PLX25_01265 [Sphaerochaeta sp.]|nr:hypothetical protein [Sphaerochaeta sp.]
MSSHPKQIELEQKLRAMADDLDHFLEDRFEGLYPLHPNRLPRGKAASVAYDGLFSTGTQFTPGYGSEYGRGYVVSVEIRTLCPVKEEDRQAIEDASREYLKEIIPIYLPGRTVELKRDGNVYKLVGDFSLGSSSNS